jgi:hypothetical protein
MGFTPTVIQWGSINKGNNPNIISRISTTLRVKPSYLVVYLLQGGTGLPIEQSCSTAFQTALTGLESHLLTDADTAMNIPDEPCPGYLTNRPSPQYHNNIYYSYSFLGTNPTSVQLWVTNSPGTHSNLEHSLQLQLR